MTNQKDGLGDPVGKILRQIMRWEVSGPHHASELAEEAIAIHEQEREVIKAAREGYHGAIQLALKDLDAMIAGKK